MRGIKTKKSGRWKRLAIFVLLILVLGVLLNSAKNIYQKKKMAGEALVRMQKEFSDLKKREEFLENSLRKLNTKEGINFEMRKKLNVAEAGESVAIIVDKEEKVSVKQALISNWQKIKNFIEDLLR